MADDTPHPRLAPTLVGFLAVAAFADADGDMVAFVDAVHEFSVDVGADADWG